MARRRRRRSGQNRRRNRLPQVVPRFPQSQKSFRQQEKGSSRICRYIPHQLHQAQRLGQFGLSCHPHLTRLQVNFQPVPAPLSLQSAIPAGIPAVPEKEYEPPMPAFGPGTPDYVPRHVQKMDTQDNNTSASKEDDREYGLKGSYF